MKNLSLRSSESLVSQTKALCADERRITVDVLHHLAEIESRRTYAEFGYSSLHAFAVHELRYSDGAAGRRIAAMKLMRLVPEVENGVRSGELNVTVAAMAKHATQGRPIHEKAEVIKVLRGQSQREAKKTLATLYPEAVTTQERERHTSADTTQITFTADAALYEKFEKLKNLMSHKNPNPTYQELFHMMADQLLKKLDPERRTRSVTPAPESRSTRSRYIPVSVRSDLWRKHEGRCAYVDTKSGRRCASKHLLQIDHINPVANGGQTEPDNLRLLCRPHNLYLAECMGLRSAEQSPSIPAG